MDTSVSVHIQNSCYCYCTIMTYTVCALSHFVQNVIMVDQEVMQCDLGGHSSHTASREHLLPATQKLFPLCSSSQCYAYSVYFCTMSLSDVTVYYL